MKKGRYSEEQIIGVLKQMEAGRTVKDLARELGVSEATLYTWKSKYGGLEAQLTTRRTPAGQNARKPPRHGQKPPGGPGPTSENRQATPPKPAP